MRKDYKKWHSKKSLINNVEKRPYFHEREIWWCSLGANVGFEQDGGSEDFLRPVIVFRKFNNKIFWAIPLTKIEKDMNQRSAKYYFKFFLKKKGKNFAILSQIRLVDARRLGYIMDQISEKDFRSLTEKLKGLFP